MLLSPSDVVDFEKVDHIHHRQKQYYFISPHSLGFNN